MKKKYILTCFIGLTFFAFSCSSYSSILKKKMDESRKALGKGDVLMAYALLKTRTGEEIYRVPTSLRARYEKLNSEVTSALEYLIEKWLSRAEDSFAKGDISNALKYYDDLLKNLPPGDEVRKVIEKESEPVRKKQASIRKEYVQLLSIARRKFASGDYSAARDSILLAQAKASKWNLELPLESQRLLEECKRRLPGVEKPEGESREDVSVSAALPPSPPKHGDEAHKVSLKDRIRRRQHLKKRRAAPKKQQGSSILDKAEKSYRTGLMLEKKGDTEKALMAFLRTSKLNPGHKGAMAALRRLEPVRKKLVEKWLKTASEFFAKEDLKSAAPYYKKVLHLDPGNLRAKEGLQMYLRLKQLKKKQK